MTHTSFNDQSLYPTLRDFVGDIGPHMYQDHPLGILFMDHTARVRQVAVFTETCLSKIRSVNNDWFQHKSKQFKKDLARENVSAVLAEIRAYGILLKEWPNSKIQAPMKDSCDFILDLHEITLRVEVNAPQWAGAPKLTSRRIEHRKIGPLYETVAELFPYGAPPEFKQDSFATMAISKVCSIKQKEHQFNDQSVAILWLDFWDPVLWYSSQDFWVIPYYISLSEFGLGHLWHSFYARKHDPIFDSAPVTGRCIKTIPLQHDGRFNQKDCKLDLVFISDPVNLFVFQNHNRPDILPDYFFVNLLESDIFKMHKSWLDWPIRGTLKSKIDLKRSEITELLRLLRAIGG